MTEPWKKYEQAAASSKPWEKYAAAPGSVAPAVPNITLPPPEQGYSGITPKDVYNFAPAFSENIPIGGGLATAGGERFGAALKYLTDLLKGDETTYNDALKAIQAENERTRAKRLEDSPMTAGLVAPMASAAMIPTPYGKAEGLAGAMGRIGGNVLLTAGDDIARGETDDLLKDTSIVGGLQTLIESAPGLKGLAGRRALKAGFGRQEKAYTDTAKKAGKLEETGEAFLSADEAGPAVVKFASTPKSIAPRADEKAKFYGKVIGDIGQEIDKRSPQSVSGPEIARRIRDVIEDNVENIHTEGALEKLAKFADTFESLGNMNFQKAQKHKDSFRFNDPKGPRLLPADVETKVKMAISNVMDDTAAAVAAKHGIPELAEDYARAKKMYGIYEPASEFVETRSKKDMAVNLVSPSDFFVAGTVGMGGFLGSQLQGGNWGESGSLSVPATMLGYAANNAIRRRGPAAAAVTAKFLGDLLERQPALFGKFKGKLQNAERSGSKSLMLTHEALLESPEYGAMINKISASLGTDKDDVAVIEDPVMIESYRQGIINNKNMPSTARAKALSDLNQNGYYEMDLTPYRQEFERQMIPAPLEGAPPSVEGLNRALRNSVGTQPG